jgi:type IV secretory pathway VirB10-like protein
MWRSEEEPERPEIREPLAKHFGDYDLPEPPEPQIIEVQVPVTQKAAVAEKTPRETPPKRAQPVRQERRQQRALPRLAEVSWRIPAVEPEPRGYRDGRVEMFAQGCALRPGVSIIPAVLLTAVNSEIPGQVIATVMSDVYSPDAGYENKVLVPAGTRVVLIHRSACSSTRPFRSADRNGRGLLVQVTLTTLASVNEAVQVC